MHDVIQQALERLALHNTAARSVVILCAAVLVYLLGAAWLAVVARHLRRLTLRTAVCILVLGLLAMLGSKVLTHVISDPRPYIVAHTPPLIPTAQDNGFPSDHTLLAAALTASLWRIDRRLLLAFAAGTILVLIGRLGVGAHHTLDVLGSLAIAVVAALVAALLPLPAAWRRPLLPTLEWAAQCVWRPIARRDPLA